MGSANFAVVAELFRLAAFWTCSFDEPVSEEHLCLRIEKLFDFSFFDEIGFAKGCPDFVAKGLVFGAMGTAVVIELNLEAVEVFHMGGVHRGDESFFLNAFGTGTEHDRGSVSIVGTDVDTVISTQFLKPCPDVGLDVLDKMTEMDMSIGVRQCSSNENLASQNRMETARSGNKFTTLIGEESNKCQRDVNKGGGAPLADKAGFVYNDCQFSIPFQDRRT